VAAAAAAARIGSASGFEISIDDTVCPARMMMLHAACMPGAVDVVVWVKQQLAAAQERIERLACEQLRFVATIYRRTSHDVFYQGPFIEALVAAAGPDPDLPATAVGREVLTLLTRIVFNGMGRDAAVFARNNIPTLTLVLRVCHVG
jgi:hypothetical protein